MKKIDVGQAIDTLANVGVIAGIVFLAVELRPNNELLRMEARRGYMVNRVEASRTAATDPYIIPLRIKASSGQPLSAVEVARLNADANSTLSLWEWEWEQRALGLLSDRPDEAYRTAVLRNPHLAKWLLESESTFDPGFVDWMKNSIIDL